MSMILRRITRQTLATLPPEAAAQAEALAVRSDERGLWMTVEDWSTLGVKTVPRRSRANDLKPPTLAEMAANFGAAMARWQAAGYPVLDDSGYQDRLAVCHACEHWKAKALIPRCKLCGCFSFKLWLPTERCRLDKWAAKTTS
jgi:hypothetical protein